MDNQNVGNLELRAGILLAAIKGAEYTIAVCERELETLRSIRLVDGAGGVGKRKYTRRVLKPKIQAQAQEVA